jgi:hypothetical protein
MTVLACCVYCSRPVDPSARSTYRRVQGWEHKALAESRRGGSDIVLREAVDVFACDVCVTRLQNGLSVSQEVLL